ncbi:MAG: hypothetical protein A2Y67_01615 [Candidatus Buchananbacteria bacterium RBG_13_39_9]|uniref:Peptidase E n=1 Tax=Candidatus Buchananbacteria bacterium RBG_13_39_9 TaxID=1797531 RepID=A0A1G1XRH4_9BACT|nr:MAG: hypothetical protein A2Y67_01615 [Candidatus Buchananbacteria bacterium RBG_13_39_9]
MKLLLTSAGLLNEKVKKKFINLLNKPAGQVKIIMFTFQRNDEEEYYVNLSVDGLTSLGIKNENSKIFDLADDKFVLSLTDFDLIYMAGGNTFDIMDKIRKLGLVEKIKDFVSKGGIYFGVSAGSVMAGPNINISSPWDENDIGLTDFAGFNFIDFAICPHYESKDDEIIKQRQKDLNVPVRLLKDDQAFLVKDREVTLVGKGEEIII